MGKSSSREVYDFLMSMDYGICYGPIDSFNQVWVKDKPIWCGDASERVDIEVHQPDLFGGDDAEGGVVGTVEAYIGDDTQVSSEPLAARAGRTPQTMPGYRGLAHLFFRGKGGEGFRWSSNNPYLPPMKASVTRLPADIAPEYKAIYAPIIGENGEFVQNPDAYGAVEGLVNFPPAPGEIPTYANQYDFYIIRDQAQAPYGSIDFGNLTADELDVMVAQGWVPTVKIDYNRRWLDTNSNILTNVNHRFRMFELDAAGNVVKTHDRQALNTDQLVINEEIVLDSATRRVEFVVTVVSNGADIVFFLNGTKRDIEVFFTDTQSTAVTFTEQDGIGFFEGANINHNAGYYIDLLALGFTEQAIDDGEISVRAVTTIAAQETGLGGGSGEAFTADTSIAGFGALPDGSIDLDLSGGIPQGIPLYASNAGETGVFTSYDINGEEPSGYAYGRSGTLILRPGTRFVSVYTQNNRLSPVLSGWTSQTISVTVVGPAKVEANVHCEVDGSLGLLPDANPAHIIYECLTNAEWGKGESPAMIDTASFEAAALTLYNEFFGLGFIWVEQTEIESFIQEVIDHIQAQLFQDPATGLWTLKLLRDDYDTAAAPLLDETNCVLTNRKRKAWGETVNEIVVTYTDPQTEKEATVTSHNLGNIAIQGGVISETRNYYGVRNPLLAKKLADRDVEAGGYPVFTAQATVDRSFWNIRPGDVVRVSWPRDGITEMVMRVMRVDYGKPTDRKIVLDLSEDIFALEQTTYGEQQGSLLDTGRALPTDMTERMVIAAPLPLMVQGGSLVEDVDASYPAVAALLLADQSPRPLDIEAHTEVVKGNGSTAVENVLTFPVSRSETLTAALGLAVTSRLPGAIIDGVLGATADVGAILMLGSNEAGGELVMLDSYDGTADEWVVLRGVWDTVPGEWPIGTRVWRFPDGTARLDPNERAGGETREYRFLPRTDFSRLTYPEATPISVTFSERPHLPFRPANCQLDGTGFAGVIYDTSLPTTITATWANRNRALEDQVANRWSDLDAAPETNQTTVLRFLDATGAFSHEITGLTGSSRVIAVGEFAPLENGFVEFLAERDGLRSMTGLRLPFDLRQGGYGLNYGVSYGP